MNVLSGEDLSCLKGINAERLLRRKYCNDLCAARVDEIDEVGMSIGDDLERILHQQHNGYEERRKSTFLHSSNVVGTGEMPRTLHKLCQEVTLFTSVPYILLNCSTIASLSPSRTARTRARTRGSLLSSGSRPKTSNNRLYSSMTGCSG